MMALFSETGSSPTTPELEFLGNLVRYRMAIEGFPPLRIPRLECLGYLAPYPRAIEDGDPCVLLRALVAASGVTDAIRHSSEPVSCNAVQLTSGHLNSFVMSFGDLIIHPFMHVPLMAVVAQAYSWQLTKHAMHLSNTKETEQDLNGLEIPLLAHRSPESLVERRKCPRAGGILPPGADTATETSPTPARPWT
jgi:hypothetical protein